MTTEVEVCNLALKHLGIVRRMTSYPDSTWTDAQMISDVFDTARLVCLSAQDWNFAQTTVQLQRLGTTPAAGFEYQYQVPLDCVRISTISEFEDLDPPLLFFHHAANNIIETDAETLYLRYVTSNAQIAYYPPYFTELLALKIASYIARPAKGHLKEKEFYEGLFQDKLRNARSVSAEQRAPQQSRLGSWAAARYGARRG